MYSEKPTKSLRFGSRSARLHTENSGGDPAKQKKSGDGGGKSTIFAGVEAAVWNRVGDARTGRRECREESLMENHKIIHISEPTGLAPAYLEGNGIASIPGVLLGLEDR